MSRNVLIFGSGGIGGNGLELLARTQGVGKLFLADKDKVAGQQRVNSALYGSQIMGFNPDIEFLECDVSHVDATARIISKAKPDIILIATTLQSWWVVQELAGLAPDVYEKIEKAALGPWVPVHLALTYKISKAIEKSGVAVQVVESSFPDVVCPVLAKLGMPATVGMGNMSLVQTAVVNVVANKMDVPLADITVWMVGHHSMTRVFADGKIGDLPYWIKIYDLDKDITDRIDMDEVFLELFKGACPPLGGGLNQVFIAASAVRNVLAIMFDTGQIVHAPGPSPGLPGGYPVRLNARGAEVVLPEGITIEEAIKINEEAAKFDGIEKIEDDGTVVCTEEAEIFEEILGVKVRRQDPEECFEKAIELVSAYGRLVEKYRQ